MEKYKLKRLSSPLTQSFCSNNFKEFIDLIHLKKNGYSSYPETFLAFHGIDLYSISYLLYVKGEDFPFATLRNMNINALKERGLKAPIHHLIDNTRCEKGFRVKKTYNELVTRSEKEHSPLLYSSNFTIHTSYRSKEMPYSKDAKDIMAAATAYDFLKLRAKGVICGAIKKYKTEGLFNSWGYEGLTDSSGDIGFFEKSGTGGEEVKIMLMKKPSQHSLDLFGKWSELFSDFSAENHTLLAS